MNNFSFREAPHNLKNFQCLFSDNKTTIKYGIETITYRGTQTKNLILESVRNVSYFSTLKKIKNKNWNADLCPCRI